ncbi:hypothetical protein BC831DRAFT_6210 [Entophlyctis helioformis]|nr:hypothetical protein BC831DRAFT_6210 [Entophlyctis helioformis]
MPSSQGNDGGLGLQTRLGPARLAGQHLHIHTHDAGTGLNGCEQTRGLGLLAQIAQQDLQLGSPSSAQPMSISATTDGSPMLVSPAPTDSSAPRPTFAYQASETAQSQSGQTAAGGSVLSKFHVSVQPPAPAAAPAVNGRRTKRSASLPLVTQAFAPDSVDSAAHTPRATQRRRTERSVSLTSQPDTPLDLNDQQPQQPLSRTQPGSNDHLVPHSVELSDRGKRALESLGVQISLDETFSSLSKDSRAHLIERLNAANAGTMERISPKSREALPEPGDTSLSIIKNALMPGGGKRAPTPEESDKRLDMLGVILQVGPYKFAVIQCVQQLATWPDHPSVADWTVKQFIITYASFVSRTARFVSSFQCKHPDLIQQIKSASALEAISNAQPRLSEAWTRICSDVKDEQVVAKINVSRPISHDVGTLSPEEQSELMTNLRGLNAWMMEKLAPKGRDALPVPASTSLDAIKYELQPNPVIGSSPRRPLTSDEARIQRFACVERVGVLALCECKWLTRMGCA